MFQGKENRIIFNFSMYLDWGDIHAEKYCVKCCRVRKNVTHIHFPIFFCLCELFTYKYYNWKRRTRML